MSVLTDKELKKLMKALKDAGLEPYVHTKARSGSIYIKFRTDIGGALRVGNHKQRGRYSYRWNLRQDAKFEYTRYKGHVCYYYPFNKVSNMIINMKRIKRNKEKFRKS